MYEIEIQYDNEAQGAVFDCRLCQKQWKFPFPCSQVLGVPQPAPHLIVACICMDALPPRDVEPSTAGNVKKRPAVRNQEPKANGSGSGYRLGSFTRAR